MMKSNSGIEQRAREDINLLGVVRTIAKWRWPILQVCLFTGIGATVISLFLPNYYQSTTTFLVASPDQVQPEVLFSEGDLRTFIYGNENDINRVLTIAESSELVNFLVDSFHLYHHYGIDSTSTKASFRVRKKFFKYYDVTKTSRDAIDLTFEDRDRKLAASIANAAREKIDQIAQNLLKQRLRKTIITFKENVTTSNRQLNLLADTLRQLRSQYGLYNTLSQSENLSSQYDAAQSKLVRNKARLEALKVTQGIPKDTIRMIEALVLGIQGEYDSLRKKMELINQGIPIVTIYEKQYWEANDALSKVKERLKKYEAAYISDIPATILVEEGRVPVVKSRPRRSIIVIGATVIAFFFSVTSLLLFEAYRDVNWQSLFHG